MIDILQYLPTGGMENAVLQSLPTGGHPPCTPSYNFFSLMPVYVASNKQHA